MAKTDLTLQRLARDLIDEHGFTLERDIKLYPQRGQIEDFCSLRLAHALYEVVYKRRPSTLGRLVFDASAAPERVKHYFFMVIPDIQSMQSLRERVQFDVVLALLVEVEEILRAKEQSDEDLSPDELYESFDSADER